MNVLDFIFLQVDFFHAGYHLAKTTAYRAASMAVTS